MKRCDACGATNADAAAWCGQCHARFPAPAPVEAPQRATVQVGAPRAPVSEVFGEALPPVPTPARAARIGVFASVDGEVEWTCTTCDNRNPIAVLQCATCGTPLARHFEAPKPAVDWQRAVGRELALPGLGHALAGQRGQAIARAGLFLLWLLGALTLLLAGGSLAAIPLILGAAVIYALGPGDVAALRDGRKPRLDGRMLSWLVVGVTVALVAAGVAQAVL